MATLPGQRPLTDFEHAIIGLLAISPMSGYDAKKAFASTPLGRYSPSSGGLYPALRRLEQLGLLSATVERTNEVRARRVFTPTESGLAELDGWLWQPITRDTVAHDLSYLLMRFALMEFRGAKQQVLAFLKEFRDAVDSYLADLESYAAAESSSATLHQRLAVEHGIAIFRASLGWAEHAHSAVQADQRRDSASVSKTARAGV